MEKRLPLIKIQLVRRLCGSLCTAGGTPGRFEQGPSPEPRLYKFSFVLSPCSKQKFTNVRTGSRAGVGKWRPASSCDGEDAAVRQQRAFCKERGKEKRNSPWRGVNTSLCSRAVVRGAPVAAAALGGSQEMWLYLIFRGINCVF